MSKFEILFERKIVRKYRYYRNFYFDNFIFIHINKTGGSSVEAAFRLPFEHKTASEKREEIGDRRWEDRFKFSIVRNPWDKVVSHYHYRVQTNQTGLADKRIDFNKWVKLSYGEHDLDFYDQPRMFMPQVRWICDDENRLMIDKVCRFEQLSHDVEEVGRIIARPVSIPHVKSSKRGNYKDYYNDESIEIISNIFADDISMFDYKY